MPGWTVVQFVSLLSPSFRVAAFCCQHVPSCPAPDCTHDVLYLYCRAVHSGGAYIELVPYRYLFQIDAGQYCLGVFDNGYQGTLLGGIITRNVLVQVGGGVGGRSCAAVL